MKKTVMAMLMLGMVPVMAHADMQAPKTNEVTWGGEFSYIQYTESSLDVKERGGMAGLWGRYDYRPGTNIVDVFHLDGRAGIGGMNYKGSGTIDNILDYVFEPRAWVGKDFKVCPMSTVTPYAGIGYRLLFDDLSDKTSSTGAQGYLRRSQYIYAPVGLEIKGEMDGWQLGVTGEYDIFIQGWQTSYLSDIAGYPDITNKQKKGFGLRGSVDIVHKGPSMDLSVSPFVRFWHIKQSETETATGTLFQVSGYEPENKSFEVGVKIGLGF